MISYRGFFFFISTGNYWNAASFPNPSSYLHFSTFQGETSADISFYFKTLIPRGVFLENLGNTDFIKLELKCEYKLFVNSRIVTSLSLQPGLSHDYEISFDSNISGFICFKNGARRQIYKLERDLGPCPQSAHKEAGSYRFPSNAIPGR